MSSARRYAYLHARVSALATYLQGAVDAPFGSEQEAQEALRRAGLDAALASHSDQVEKHALETLVAEAALLIRPLIGAPRELLRHWVRRFELMNMKALIRAKLNTGSRAQVRAQLLDLGPLTDLPIDDLLHAEDLPDLLRQLEATPYSIMARHARRSYEQRRDLFGVESALERQYFAGLIQRLYALPRSDRPQLRDFLATMLDQINLTWLLRYRFAYGLEPPQAYFLLVPLGSGLGGALLHLARLESMAQVLAELPEVLRKVLDGSRSVREVELRMSARTQAAAWRVLRTAGFDLARAVAYLYLREQQLHRLHMLVKGRSLRLSSALVRAAADLPRAAAG